MFFGEALLSVHKVPSKYNNKFPSASDMYCSTWANLTLIKSYLTNVKIFKIYFLIFFKKILKENIESDGIFENISFVEMESSKLINYLTNMCPSDLGTIILYDMPRE
jgi:hypothetical protein